LSHNAATPRQLVALGAATLGFVVTLLLVTAGAAPPASARSTHPTKRAARKHSVARRADPVASGIGPCPDTNLMPAAGNIGRIERSTLCLINAQRRHYGLQPLVEDTRLDSAAQGHSDDMVSRGYFEHNSPGGSTPVTRMFSAGYLSGNVGYEVGENIAWGTMNLATPAAIVNAWMHSPDHRANILRGAYRQEGLGVNPSAPGALGQGQTGGTYTQDFGVILGG
jgi:uncharacterized protein YkwD